MRIGRSPSDNRTRVVIVTADEEFERAARETFGASSAIDLVVVSGRLAERCDKLPLDGATVVVVDFDASQADEMAAMSGLMARIGNWPPVIAITQTFDESVARTLLQMRIADFLVKPVAPVDLVRACAQVAKGPSAASEPADAQIYTFLPAVGGAGVTTLAVQTAMLLLNSGGPHSKPSTCLVDLDFQHGAVADYLDLEPRLNLAEIEPRPDRLDRQLLEVMLSYHASGLAVVAAPNQAGGDALVRSRRGDAPARSRLRQFPIRRVRHAAHLVLLDRQRAARLQQAVHRRRDHGAGHAPRQATGDGDPRAAATAPIRRSSSTASSRACSPPACA